MNEYRYDYETVKGFILSAIFWGVVGLIAGLWISAQL
jgi:cytochrome c oxidase cbb3-type subunit 1